MTRNRPSDAVDIRHGDALDVLRGLPDESVDAVITDPPYGLEFMGKDWDAPWKTGNGFRRARNPADVARDNPFGRSSRTSPEYIAGIGFQHWCEEWATECLRILKPGGFILTFGGTRTVHRLGVAIEDAGFEIRDRIRVETTGVVLPSELGWLHGQGFPKNLDVGKAIDRAAGADRDSPRSVGPVVSGKPHHAASSGNRRCLACGKWTSHCACLADADPATEDAARWSGWGTALKPAYEPIIVARKPLAGTVAQNVLTYGTGALNIDATRVHTEGSEGKAYTVKRLKPGATLEKTGGVWRPDGDAHLPWEVGREYEGHTKDGRWPSNVVLVHGEGCVPVGTRKVRSQSPAVPQPSGRVFQDVHSRNGEMSAGYADEDGTETVEAWECVEGCPVAEMDAQSGTLTSGVPGVRRKPHATDAMSGTLGMIDRVETGYADTGGASRFFATFKYQAKADGSERPSYIGPVCHSDSGCSQVTDEMHPSVWPEWARDPKGVCPECGTPCGPIMHPTVKPLELARWLIRLVVAKGGTFIDPFVGSGTFAEAAILEGVNAIVVDKVGAHIPFIEQRVTKYDNPHAMAAAQRGEKVATRAKARKGIVTDDEDDLFADWAS